MSPYKRLRLSSRRCVWFCSIAALSGSKAQPPLLDYYPQGLANRPVKYDTYTHTEQTHLTGIYSKQVAKRSGENLPLHPSIHPFVFSFSFSLKERNGFLGDLPVGQLITCEVIRAEASLM